MTPPFTAEELQETRKPLLQATQLPPRSYVDESVADWEAENLFLGGWVCVGHAQPLAERGNFVTRQIKDESLLFVGDDEGRAHGFFNVCRHRGARLVSEPEGKMRRLQCPYHAWCYRFDGSLLSAPHTEEIEDFDPATSGLNRLRMEEVHGLLFADVSGTAGPLADHLGELTPAPRALPPRRPAPRRRDHLRRRGQLEGDRRELLRVPALPRRAPRAQPPLALHERRRVRGRRRLVRRLDDAQRRRRDDGAERRPRHRAPRSPA